MAIVQQIWNELRAGENIDLYLTILAAIVLLLLDLLGIPISDWMFSINIAILALLAVSMLVNRYRLEKIGEKIEQSPTSVFLDNFPDDFEKKIFSTKELWVVGVNLGTTMPTLNRKFLGAIKRKISIKFLVVNPNSIANTLASNRLIEKVYDPATHRSVILQSLAIMTALKDEAPSRVEIRTINYVPSFGYFAADIETIDGALYLEHYGYKLTSGDKPRMVLRPKDDKWYKVFKEQLLTLWHEAEEWPNDVGKRLEP